MLPTRSLNAQGAASSNRSTIATLAEFERSLDAFESIAGVRELSDGRVLLIDAAGRTLVVLDALLRTSRQIGRSGDGPGEYRYPALIFALGRDSTIVMDGSDRRWLLLVNDRFEALGDDLAALKIGIRGDLVGVSSGGALDLVGVGTARKVPFPGVRGRAEGHERVAMLARKTSGSIDTVALGQTMSFGFARKNGRAVPHIALHPLQSNDQAALFPDGRIATARLQPYSVGWRSPRGQQLRMTIVDDSMPRLTKAARRVIAQDYVREADGYSVFTDTDFALWPDRAPPFTSRSLIAGLDGRLYVMRTRMGDAAPRRVDVFSAEFGFEGALELPPKERLLAVGTRAIYVARLNDDDEEVLVRYRPVSFRR
jgi:hypothetical protein